MKFLKWFFRSDQQAKDETARRKGEEFGRQLYDKIEAFGNDRLDVMVSNLLNVFRSQLEKIPEDGEHPPKYVAAAELEIFNEQIAVAQDRWWNEVREHIEPEITIAAEIGGLQELIADLIEGVTEPRLKMLIAGAKVLYDAKIESLSKET